MAFNIRQQTAEFSVQIAIWIVGMLKVTDGSQDHLGDSFIVIPQDTK
jgi:hypothetical protein